MATCLLLTADPVRREELHRLAATAAVDVEVVTAVERVRPSWSEAGLVLLGRDLLVEAAAAGLGRRPGVVVLGDDVDDPTVWREAVEVGAEHVVFLPDAEPWLLLRLGETAEGARPPGRLLAVVGGSGGAGASTLAVALAQAASQLGHEAVLVDGDPLGGGLDLLLGIENDSGVRWAELAGTHGRLPSHTLRQALPSAGPVPVVSFERRWDPPVPEPAVQAVVAAVRRAADLVVVDLPRTVHGPWQDVVRGADHVLLVSRAEVRAAAAASVTAAALARWSRALSLVVRETGELSGQEVADALGLPLGGRLREDSGLRRAIDRGDGFALPPRGPLSRTCRDLLAPVLGTDPVAGRGSDRAA